MIHINDQTVTDEPVAPFGGVGISGNGYRIGSARADLEAFTATRWVTINESPATHPF